MEARMRVVLLVEEEAVDVVVDTQERDEDEVVVAVFPAVMLQ
jgi:hypothetical protein